jgi:hypothetical protein
MLHTLRYSLQNAVYFTMLTFLVPVLFAFYIQDVINLNIKLRCQKVNIIRGCFPPVPLFTYTPRCSWLLLPWKSLPLPSPKSVTRDFCVTVGQFCSYTHRKLLLEHAVVASYFHKTVVDDIARRDTVFMLPRLHKDIYNYIYPYI